ncbi:hypothetical protein LUQ84_000615 [Hamiltosporidium tvaerminnensis]|nr:hypothetical protein LUQ84_000615 [Hamiltosporidium tvaerminnensis]
MIFFLFLYRVFLTSPLVSNGPFRLTVANNENLVLTSHNASVRMKDIATATGVSEVIMEKADPQSSDMYRIRIGQKYLCKKPFDAGVVACDTMDSNSVWKVETGPGGFVMRNERACLVKAAQDNNTKLGGFYLNTKDCNDQNSEKYFRFVPTQTTQPTVLYTPPPDATQQVQYSNVSIGQSPNGSTVITQNSSVIQGDNTIEDKTVVVQCDDQPSGCEQQPSYTYSTVPQTVPVYEPQPVYESFNSVNIQPQPTAIVEAPVEPVYVQNFVPSAPVPPPVVTHPIPRPMPVPRNEPAQPQVIIPRIEPSVQPVGPPVLHPIQRPIPQPVMQPIPQPMPQPVMQPIPQPIVQPIPPPQPQPVMIPIQQPPNIQPVNPPFAVSAPPQQPTPVFRPQFVPQNVVEQRPEPSQLPLIVQKTLPTPPSQCVVAPPSSQQPPIQWPIQLPIQQPTLERQIGFTLPSPKENKPSEACIVEPSPVNFGTNNFKMSYLPAPQKNISDLYTPCHAGMQGCESTNKVAYVNPQQPRIVPSVSKSGCDAALNSALSNVPTFVRNSNECEVTSNNFTESPLVVNDNKSITGVTGCNAGVSACEVVKTDPLNVDHMPTLEVRKGCEDQSACAEINQPGKVSFTEDANPNGYIYIHGVPPVRN